MVATGCRRDLTECLLTASGEQGSLKLLVFTCIVFIQITIPSLLRLHPDRPRLGSRPFRFEAAWVSHPEYLNLVEETWQACEGSCGDKLTKVKEASTDFNREVFGNIFQHKRHITNRLSGIQKAMETVDSIRLSMVEADLRKELDRILWQEETLWFQKSREQWIKFGDGNTKFFHAQTIIRRKRNRVEGLFLRDGSWSTDPVTLQTEASDYFHSLFVCLHGICLPGLFDF